MRTPWIAIAASMLLFGSFGCDDGSGGNQGANADDSPEQRAGTVAEEQDTVEEPPPVEVTKVEEGIASTIEEEEPLIDEDAVTEETDSGETGELEMKWDETQHLIMETAMSLYPTYKVLHQYAVGPGCGPITGVCHNTKEYPDLHSSANMLDTVGANCNVLIDGPAVTENVCERKADEIIITSGLDVGFRSAVGTLELMPPSVGCGEDPADTPGEEVEVCAPSPDGPTWVEDVQPIIQAKCGNCHGTPPTAAPIALNTYEEIIKPTASPDIHRYDRVLARMNDQTMPPGGGNTNAELQVISDWIENCHTREGEEVVENALDEEGEDLCIRLKDPIPTGMSIGEIGVDFSILRQQNMDQPTMVVVEYADKLQTESGSHYVRLRGFSDLTDQEQATFLYTIITGDPNGDGIFGYDAGEAGLVIKPGDPAKSYFVWRMMGWGEAPQMPLAGEPLLPPAQLAVMCWIYNMSPGSDLEAMDEIDYTTCYHLLEYFDGVAFDPDQERNH